VLPGSFSASSDAPRAGLLFLPATTSWLFGVLQAARELKLRCPEDLSIAGFDSLEFTKLTDPSLTSVLPTRISVGPTAARLLLQRATGCGPRPKKVLLPTELKKRNSVGTASCRWSGKDRANHQSPRTEPPGAQEATGLRIFQASCCFRFPFQLGIDKCKLVE